MKTIRFSEDTILVEQLVLDHRANLLLNIYQMGKKFSFRYVQSDKDSFLGRIDPLNDSDNYSWGYGTFDSPDQAVASAHDYYLNHGYLVAAK